MNVAGNYLSVLKIPSKTFTTIRMCSSKVSSKCCILPMLNGISKFCMLLSIFICGSGGPALSEPKLKMATSNTLHHNYAYGFCCIHLFIIRIYMRSKPSVKVTFDKQGSYDIKSVPVNRIKHDISPVPGHRLYVPVKIGLDKAVTCFIQMYTWKTFKILLSRKCMAKSIDLLCVELFNGSLVKLIKPCSCGLKYFLPFELLVYQVANL